MMGRVPFYATSGPPPFDPSVFNATTWQGKGFTGYNWAGLTSSGPSGNRELRNYNGSVIAGSSLKGFASILHDNSVSAQTCGSQYYNNAGGLALDIHEVVDPGPSNGGPFSYTVMGLSRINSAAAPAGAAVKYVSQTLINGNARWFIYFDDTNVGMVQYDGTFPFVEAPHPGVGVIFKWCVRWTQGSNNAQVDIDSTPGTPTAMIKVAVLDGVGCLIANDAFNSALGSHETWDIITVKSALSDADRDNYFSYLSSQYGV